MENNIATSVPQEALPDQDFMEMVNRIEGSQKPAESPTSPSDDVIMVETPAGPVPLSKKAVATAEVIRQEEVLLKKEPEPIKLEYRFTGQCNKHLTDVSTLTAEVDGKCICFAFCQSCNKNVYSQTVPIIGDGVPPQRTFKRGGKSL